jgi:starch-binding outer membrane protein, SusD/RagB family
MNIHTGSRRHGSRLATLTLASLLLGCNGLLDVTNPSAITEDNLAGDAQTVQFMMNGVIGEFRREYAWLAAHGAMFTDEAIQGHPWSPWNVYDQRNITPDSPAYDGLSYQLLQRARGTADALIPKMEAALGTEAATSIELARALAYAGYSYLMVADFMCEAPINVSAPVPSAELYLRAIERFDQAIAITTAAASKTGASDVLNLAKVGKARAHLNRNEGAAAIAAATGVPAAFAALVRYTPDAADWQVYNFMHWFAGYRFAGELDLALDPARFAGLTDSRIPFDPAPRRLGNGVRDGLLVYQTASYSGHAPAGAVMFSDVAAIRFASGLEAQYIIAEAGGMSAAALRTFVDSRRAAGGLAPFGGTDAQLTAELLEQRFRDFFLDGHRMGDLRRYKAHRGLDLWPTGLMPGLTQNYGTQECWPIAASERNANPNVP